jgi:hypothetical protein
LRAVGVSEPADQTGRTVVSAPKRIIIEITQETQTSCKTPSQARALCECKAKRDADHFDDHLAMS